MLLVTHSQDTEETYLEVLELVLDEWKVVKPMISVSIGKSGLIEARKKREGDGKTPIGFYPIERAYGFEEFPNFRINYTKLKEDDLWIDDPKSKFYNQQTSLKKSKLKKHRLSESRNIYQLFLVIEHNTKRPIPYHGSMLFLHPWEATNGPTSGCIGLEFQELKEITEWLDPKQKPYLVIIDKE